MAEFLHQHPRVHLHFTPSYSSWLNHVEIWLRKIQGDVVDRGVFASDADLLCKLMNISGSKANPPNRFVGLILDSALAAVL